MRIIAGSARGRRLFAPPGLETRPTADRVREALFNILSARVPDARVLDLFAGSGAMALEALSRGAREAVLVDVSRTACQVIGRNIALTGWEDRCRVLNRDWRQALAGLTGAPFDLVFMDPPYRMLEVYPQAAQALRDGGLLTAEALLVMEHRATDDLALPRGCVPADERRYGETKVTFARWES